MKPIHSGGMKSIPRRVFLQAVGVTLGLPLLEVVMRSVGSPLVFSNTPHERVCPV